MRVITRLFAGFLLTLSCMAFVGCESGGTATPDADATSTPDADATSTPDAGSGDATAEGGSGTSE